MQTVRHLCFLAKCPSKYPLLSNPHLHAYSHVCKDKHAKAWKYANRYPPRSWLQTTQRVSGGLVLCTVTCNSWNVCPQPAPTPMKIGSKKLDFNKPQKIHFRPLNKNNSDRSRGIGHRISLQCKLSTKLLSHAVASKQESTSQDLQKLENVRQYAMNLLRIVENVFYRQFLHS